MCHAEFHLSFLENSSGFISFKRVPADSLLLLIPAQFSYPRPKDSNMTNLPSFHHRLIFFLCFHRLAFLCWIVAKMMPVYGSKRIHSRPFLSLTFLHFVRSCWAVCNFYKEGEDKKAVGSSLSLSGSRLPRRHWVICLYKSLHQVLKRPAMNTILLGDLRFSFSSFVWKMKEKEKIIESPSSLTTGRKVEKKEKRRS